MSKVSFVIPCYRSSKTIGGVVNEIESTMAQLAYEYEIILVNDSSPDDTFAVISALAEADGHIRRRPCKELRPACGADVRHQAQQRRYPRLP